MINRIQYNIIYFIFYLHALLPFRVLYLLSDVLFFFIYYIVGYRKKVTRRNLAAAFPKKNDKERLKIEKQFYHHFCDYFVETIKLFHISDKEMESRMVFKNMELIRDFAKQGKSVIFYLGHYGNWEWVTSIKLSLKNDMEATQIYRPLKNKVFDDLFLNLRKRFGSIGISKNNVLRPLVKFRQEKQKIVIGFMADQTPSTHNIHYWTTFMNQETPVFTGVERIAKQLDYPVVYLDIIKTGRGRYLGEIRLLTDKPKEEPEFSITEKYIREMENTILRNPAYWLWTHKRWKYKREDIEKK